MIAGEDDEDEEEGERNEEKKGSSKASRASGALRPTDLTQIFEQASSLSDDEEGKDDKNSSGRIAESPLRCCLTPLHLSELEQRTLELHA